MQLAEFNERLQQSRHPVVVDLWAPWCGPCKAVKPILKKLAHEYSGRVELWQINADDSPEVLRALHIYGIPTLVAYRDGKEAARYVGAKPPQALHSLFENLATGREPAVVGIAIGDRFLRLGAGLILVLISWHFSYWPLLIVGGIVMFTAVHDRCPIWRAVKSSLSRVMNRTQQP